MQHSIGNWSVACITVALLIGALVVPLVQSG